MKEYIIWGIAPDGEYEVPLYTQCVTMAQAVKVQGILEKDHGCTECRIHVLDLSAVPNFAGVVAV